MCRPQAGARWGADPVCPLPAQEQERPVGVLTSSVYGRRICQPVEPLNREHGRANHVKADFYRKNGVPGLQAPDFGHVEPA